MDHRHTLAEDTVLDRKYRIGSVIGSGGFGITYKALDLGLDTPVAVKEYYPAQFGMRDATLSVRARSEGERPIFERMRSSFLREARTLAQFDHPTIVRVLNVFEAHGTAYMVMKFESGPSLKAWLADLGRPCTQAELDAITAPILDALELMHSTGFLHRDIAPDNIILRSDGTPVMLDFGASRRVMGPMSGALTGIVKMGYSPPEQYATDARTQGPWTDIYAMASTLYIAITGEAPLEATSRMLEDALVPASSFANGDYRPEFLAAVDRALALKPKNRPQSVAEWRGELFRGTRLDRTPAPAVPFPMPRPTAVEDLKGPGTRPGTQPDSNPVGSSPPAPAAGARLNRALLGVAIAMVVGGTAVVAANLLRSTDPGPPLVSVSRDTGGALTADIASEEARRRDIEQASAALRARDEAARKAREEAAKKAEADRVAAAELAVRREREDAERKAAAEAAHSTRVLVADIRRELNRIGCTTAATAPEWTDADQKALERFAEDSGGTSSFPELNRDIVRVLGGFRQPVCQVRCAAGETAINGRCERAPQSATPATQPQTVTCSQINERAQLGLLTESDIELLRTLNCRK
jgi:serine/threonine protein kinase